MKKPSIKDRAATKKAGTEMKSATGNKAAVWQTFAEAAKQAKKATTAKGAG